MTIARPLIVGEVLFDHFPDGQRVLGGAPFNVAWNLQGLGASPVFISAVGDDDEGRDVIARMKAWGMETAGVQISQRLPTGQVRVELDGAEPTFHILDQQAYDDIQFPPSEIIRGSYSLLYVGSLAFRNDTTRSTIRQLMRDSKLPRFVDINIREPWFERNAAAELLKDSAWVKLNQKELSFLSDMECQTPGQIRDAVVRVRDRYGGGQYFVTCGAAGVHAIDEAGEAFFVEAPKPPRMVDTVGAGDAFAAAVIFGICRDRPLDELLRTAAEFASRACAIHGATSEDSSHYAI